jgi:hypothetical protein
MAGGNWADGLQQHLQHSHRASGPKCPPADTVASGCMRAPQNPTAIEGHSRSAGYKPLRKLTSSRVNNSTRGP